MTVERDRRVVAVLGMHRSGTSAVASVIHSFGVPTTDDLLPADEGNPLGYWESRRIVEHDDRLLEGLNSTWATPPTRAEIATLSHELSEVTEARRLLDEVMVRPTAVIKDPRMSLLLPFWDEVLDTTPVLVVVHRNPVAVARSLRERHRLSLSHGVALWEHYTREILRSCEGRATYLVDFDRALENRGWVGELRAMLIEHGLLEAQLDTDWDENVTPLDLAHRRHRASVEEVHTHCSVGAVELADRVTSLAGRHDAFPSVTVGSMTAWAEELLASRRGLEVANRRVEALQHEIDEERERNLRTSKELEEEYERLRGAVEEAADVADAALAEADSARTTLDLVLGSTSWRVSAPIRRLGGVRRWLRGGVGGFAPEHLRRAGARGVATRAGSALGLSDRRATHDYRRWIERYEELNDAARRRIESAVQRLERTPLISVLMPVFDAEPEHLREAVDSVRHQLYPYWQLCIVDDASSKQSTRAMLEHLESADPRITVVRRTRNGGIAAATNTALAAAEGDYVAFLDHDDVLAPHALFVVADALNGDPTIDLLYSDEDKIDGNGRRHEPYFKPDFNPELLLGQNYFNHLTVARRTLVKAVGGLRAGFEGAQDHDLVLRAVSSTTADRIVHLPYVLYHWRQYSGSVSFSRTHSERATAAGTRAVQEHLDRTGEDAIARPDARTPGWQRVHWFVPTPPPEVTVVIPTRDRLSLLRTCVEGLLHRTDYPAMRILVVDNDSEDPATLEYLDGLREGARTHVMTVPGPFNYSALNNRAVDAVSTPLVLLLNNDIEVQSSDWLEQMVALAVRDGVGAVGAKLHYGNGTIQHAGVVLGIGGVAGHAHKYRSSRETGYFGRLVLTQEVSAVTGACLLTHRDVWNEVGGLDEEHLPIAFNDVDYCLRLRERGHRVVWAANAELLHLESVSRGREESAAQVARFNRETAWMRRRWGAILDADPMYNPNLTHLREDYSLAFPPRVQRLGSGRRWPGTQR